MKNKPAVCIKRTFRIIKICGFLSRVVSNQELVEMVQGLPSGFDLMYLTLADRNMQVRFGLKVVWKF